MQLLFQNRNSGKSVSLSRARQRLRQTKSYCDHLFELLRNRNNFCHWLLSQVCQSFATHPLSFGELLYLKSNFLSLHYSTLPVSFSNTRCQYLCEPACHLLRYGSSYTNHHSWLRHACVRAFTEAYIITFGYFPVHPIRWHSQPIPSYLLHRLWRLAVTVLKAFRTPKLPFGRRRFYLVVLDVINRPSKSHF